MRRIWMILAGIMLAAGAALFFYPVVTQWMSDQENQELIREYEESLRKYEGTFQTVLQDTENEEIETLKPEESTGEAEGTAAESEEDTALRQLYEKMQAYNQEIYENGQRDLKDPFSYEETSFDLKEWNAEDMFGYLLIPRMDLELPVYLGASEENMNKGAVHLSQTSIPIGGENTNGVIAAHRGWTTSLMFQDIEKLKIGDSVRIRNFWGTLEYEVAEIRIILPEEVDQVLIQEGRDLLTLITCHPYTKNYQRYVVYCERTGQDEDYPQFSREKQE